MKKIISVFCISILMSCSSTRIKNENYTVSDTSPELGTIGFSELQIRGNSQFKVRTLTKLESPIRIAIDIIPFTRKTNIIYNKKARYNQAQTKINYSDTLLVKPELVTLSFMDFVKLIGEINGQHNDELFRFIRDTEESRIITSVSCVFALDDIQKIKQADVFYINQFQESKYVISLYKQGKKIDTIIIVPSQILAYQSSKFCWGITDRGKWYLSDIINTDSSCKGKTVPKIKNKKVENNLFDL